jgi:transposase
LPASVLSLVPAGLTVDRLLPGAERIVLVARPGQDAAPCPACACPSARRHSAYQRHLADLPWQGRLVELRVQVRRLRCANAACPRVIFAEPLPGVARPKARRTARLREAQTSVGLALGGEPGSRLAKKLAMPVSGDTLLRLVRATGAAPIAAPRVRVLGVDDWAWRRGQRYGTILCDLEGNRVVDLLPDRSAATLAGWLERHPGVELIARDRAGTYADGARQGAPDATQVADRWHLLKNLSEALKHVADRYHSRIRATARTGPATVEGALGPVPAPRPRPPPTKLEQGQRDRLAARQARFDHVVALRGRGLTLDAVVAAAGLSRSTVKRWSRRGSVPTWRKPRRASILDGHRDHLERRWREGCRNAGALWRELRARGFTGRPGVVRQWAARVRRRENAVGQGPPPPPRVPSGRRLARLLTTEPARLGANDRRLVELARAAAPELAEAADLAVAFARMVRDKGGGGDRLDDWLDAAAASGLAPVARGLRQDLPAVRAALALPWSTSPVEGQINRPKTIKRQMYGRAGFDLLRRRILAAA